MRRRNRRIGEYAVNHRQRRRGNYRRKRQHKRMVKEYHAKLWGMPDWEAMVQNYMNASSRPWGHPLDYWKNFDKSERRRHARRATNRKIRREFRDEVRTADFEDARKAMRGREYRAYHDYKWEVE